MCNVIIKVSLDTPIRRSIMPRISQLPSLTTADNTDEIAIVDVSASTTKKITRGDLLKAPMPADSVTTAAIADGAVTAAKIETQQGWQAPTLLNSWVNYGSTYATAGYMKDSLGFVHLKGAIKSGTTTAGTVIFTLPAGYRPAQDNYYPGVSTTAGSAGSFQIKSSGDVTTIVVNSGFFSFGQLVFKAEA